MTKLSANDRDQNIATVIELSKECYPNTPILASLVACQAILESGLEKAPPSLLALEYCNLFGQKPGSLVRVGTDGIVALSTKEFVNNEPVTVSATFLKNKEIEDSFEQRKLLFNLDRYKNLKVVQTFEEAAQEIRLDGYATDISYSTSLIEIYHKYMENQ